MYIYFLYGLFIIFMFACMVKSNNHKCEWIFLLVILSYVKTCITFLFNASAIFVLASIGGFQIHLDDVVLVILFLYVIFELAGNRLYKSGTLAATLLIIIPIGWTLIRGFLVGNMGSVKFLSDIRKYISFTLALISFFFIFQKAQNWYRLWKWEVYLNRLMNIVLIYVYFVWILDVFFGVHSLPGQYGGTLSDGGSTMRIMNPPQVLMIAFYALYEIYNDIMDKEKISLRTILFMLSIFLMQWRTVIGAFCVGVLVAIIYFIVKGKFTKKRIIVQVTLLTLIGLIIVFGFDNSSFVSIFRNLFDSFLSINNDTGTYSTRTVVWAMLLGSLSGINKWIGQPFGSGYSDAVAWNASAHSGYVDYIMITGYIGVAMLAVFMLYILILAIRKKKPLIAVMIVMQLVYWYGYGFSIEQGALIGFILAVLNKVDCEDHVDRDIEVAMDD